MVVYTWEFPAFDIVFNDNDLTDVVTTVHWRLRGNQANTTAELYGTIVLLPPDPNSYTPFEQLTKEQVVEWVEDSFNPELLEKYKQMISDNIEEKLNPTRATVEPPWL